MKASFVLAVPALAVAVVMGVFVSESIRARSPEPSQQATQRWEYRVVSDTLFFGGGRGNLVAGAEYQRTAEYRNANPTINPKLYNDYSALLQQGLTTLGNEGWELCYVNEREDRYIFRRPGN